MGREQHGVSVRRMGKGKIASFSNGEERMEEHFSMAWHGRVKVALHYLAQSICISLLAASYSCVTW